MQIVSKDLVYTYSEKAKALAFRALDGVTLTIPEGEFFGIIGQTGSGKSTFVQHLNGLIPTKEGNGQLLVGEFDLTDKNTNLKELRKKVGMVFQYPEYQLFAETVFEDVAFGLKNFYPDLPQVDVEDRVKQAITTVGLDYDKIKEKSPFELSGGQKRRVAIAGVIVSRPEVLVLDEPVAGLDPVGKREFARLLKTLHATFVKTVVIVSHDMDFVAEYCSSVAVFSKGKVVKVGTPKQVFEDRVGMREMGLDIPVTEYLKDALKEKGVILDCDLSVESFTKAVAEKFAKNKGETDL
ncbi:MAG: energy-coupling factor transporter ATPase [Clostridia bacterium]|nr:energy-coupling factor transporter ATPase [Clostridia bacterium]